MTNKTFLKRFCASIPQDAVRPSAAVPFMQSRSSMKVQASVVSVRLIRLSGVIH